MEIWTVFRKTYPQPDEDVCWDMEMEYFNNKPDAVRFANELEITWSDDGWNGHPYHNSKFYAAEVSPEYVQTMKWEAACRKAASYIVD